MILKNLFLCDAATANPDNTFSVLKGGINTLNISFKSSDNIKPPIKIALVATLELEMTEMGRLHNFELALLNADGQRLIPDLKSHFQAPTSQRKGFYNIILNIYLPIKTPGEYCFYINVDGHELGTHNFDVVDVDSR